ncbi:MAG TPA: electron transfer flavoprotein subunit alpha [Acidimicrobiaceae bacterium]|nr:electron transfer flavoprotein subunit alpha [Acidimicrobiaceae bacterium]
MRVGVCVKRVPSPGSRINVTDDALAVDAAKLGFTTSPHEECAVEAAVQLVEAGGGEVVVITLGPAEAAEQLRTAASVGATAFVLVEAADGCDWDPQRTAAALATEIAALEERDGTFDVLLFGNESADSGNFQVGVRVAHALGRPIVNGVKGIELSAGGDGAAPALSARRETDAGFEVYELPLPCALGVKEGINLPRYPTMKGRLASRKAEIETAAAAGLAAEPGGQRRVRLHRPPEAASDTTVLGDSAAAAPAVVDLLDELGLL